MAIPHFTIEQFRSTRMASDDLAADTNDDSSESNVGMVYGGFDEVFLFIERNASSPSGFVLVLDRSEYRESLEDLELRLYNFAVSEGYILSQSAG